LLKDGPPSKEDLQEWLWAVLGIWLPNRSICDGHCSQLDFFKDVYYEKELDILLWAARLWGKSFQAGLICWLKARYKSLWEANICAGSGAQAGRVYKATDLFWRATESIGARAALRKEPLKTYTQFLNGSMYEITTSSTKSQRGPHPNALFADEIDEMDVEVMNSAMDQTADQYGHKGTNVLMSTMHKVGGLMGYWVDNAEIRGYKLYISCILEAMESCLDYRCDNCNIDEYCERRLQPICLEEYHRQLDIGIIQPNQQPYMGHNTVENIQRKVRQGYETDESTGTIRAIDVAAELFCRRPSRTGLVFPEFNDNFHIVPADQISIPTEWPKGCTTDFGFSAPYVELRFAVTPRDQIIFYYEFVQAGMTLDEIADDLKAGRKHTRFLRTFGDPAGATEIETLRRRGIPIEPVVSEIVEGLNFMHHLLRMRIDGNLPAFIISSDCRIFINEMRKLSYPEKGDSEKPVKKDDHCVEAARRAIVAWRRGWLQPLDQILKDVKTGGRGHVRETSTDTAYRETKTAARKLKTGRRKRIESGRESTLRTSDYLR
jgi:hypothetical protein